MSLRDKIKAKMGLVKKEDEAPKPEPVPPGQAVMKPIAPLPKPKPKEELPTKTPKPPPPPPAIIGHEDVAAKCGHTVKFALFEDKKDRFRAQRKLKLTSRDCPDCRKKSHAEQLTRAAEKKMLKAQGGWKKNASTKLGRLPNGSSFQNVIFDAEKQEWSGQLIVGPVFYPLCSLPPTVQCLSSWQTWTHSGEDGCLPTNWMPRRQRRKSI